MLLIRLGDLLGILAVLFVWIPYILAMAERGVKHAALAVFFAPGDRVMARFLGVGMRFEREQLVHFLRVVILDDVNLVKHREGVAQMFGGGMLFVLVDGVHGNL